MCKSLHHKKQKVLGTIYLKSVSTTITRDSHSPRTRPNEVTCRRTTRKPGKYQLATWNRRPKHQRGRVPLEKGLLVLVEREKSRQTKKYEKNRLVQKLPSSSSSFHRRKTVSKPQSHGTVRVETDDDRWSLEVHEIEQRGGSRRAVGQTDARQRREFKGAGKRVVLSGAF